MSSTSVRQTAASTSWVRVTHRRLGGASWVRVTQCTHTWAAQSRRDGTV